MKPKISSSFKRATKSKNRVWQRLLALAIGSMFLSAIAPTIVQAAEPPTLESLANTTSQLQVSIDTTWVLLAGFLIFFMQTGFAMLEAGFIRQRGVVNALTENFIDAGLTALAFWTVGFAIAFGSSAGGIIGTSHFFLSDALTLSGTSISYATGADGSDTSLNTYTLFFFQFAFAATASTIATGALAERTDFVGDLIYSVIVGAIGYPIIVHWVWNSGGWLSSLGYHDFAGSSVVHLVGGTYALIGAYLLGPRPNRSAWGQTPPPHNLGLATLGTLILWFGWYGFNPGSSLGMDDPGLVGLVTVNTTLSSAAGAVAALLLQYFRSRKWELSYCLNGALGGLVGITAGCAYVLPWASVLIGLTAGVLVIISMNIIEAARIDDAVGAFSVHGVCGMMGTLAVGFLAQRQLTSNQTAGLLVGGGFKLLWVQFLGVVSIAVFTVAFAFLMFGALKAVGRLRVHPDADEIGIDAYEHGASIWPDIYSIEKQLGDKQEDRDRRAKIANE